MVYRCLLGRFWSARLGKIISGFSSFHFNVSVGKTEKIHTSACCGLQTLWVHIASSCNLWKQVTRHGLCPDGNPALIKLGMAQSSIPGGSSCLGTQAEEKNPDGWQRPSMRIHPLVPWSWALDVALCLGGWEHRGCWLMWPPAAVPVWYSEPAASPRWGGIQRCIVLPSPPPRTELWLCGFVRLGGKKATDISM